MQHPRADGVATLKDLSFCGDIGRDAVGSSLRRQSDTKLQLTRWVRCPYGSCEYRHQNIFGRTSPRGKHFPRHPSRADERHGFTRRRPGNVQLIGRALECVASHLKLCRSLSFPAAPGARLMPGPWVEGPHGKKRVRDE